MTDCWDREEIARTTGATVWWPDTSHITCRMFRMFGVLHTGVKRVECFFRCPEKDYAADWCRRGEANAAPNATSKSKCTGTLCFDMHGCWADAKYTVDGTDENVQQLQNGTVQQTWVCPSPGRYHSLHQIGTVAAHHRRLPVCSITPITTHQLINSSVQHTAAGMLCSPSSGSWLWQII